MINDIFTLGALAGVIANIPVNLFDFFLYHFGINKIYIWHISTSVFVEKKDIKTGIGLFIGFINDYSVAGVKGVITAFLLHFTGSEFYLLKGITVGLFFWLIIFGCLLRLKIAHLDPVEPITNLSHLTWHILFGALTSWLIVYLGDM
ncbi:hypothetical protein [Natranaerobius trueperi]|uniref:Uncharacterized protein n=1 Tax=Natranaerobius trueperi TaxID=759412 RepID=A0A226BWX2_9FIRM|nr:hypothetical protein [Natranaerobius trueperi]OWZ83411.1 hypothetical protein CDO51_08930 [Natranaerobius trueperi]